MTRNLKLVRGLSLMGGELGAILPDDLAELWYLTDWSLSYQCWSLHIALCVYPIPQCFEIARRYERTMAERKEFGKPSVSTKKKKKPKQKEQMELW
jgi:hypothetical protein